MAEYIELEIAKRFLVQDYAYAASKLLDEVPKADVAPVVHGRWVKIYENGEPSIEQHKVGVFCSRCMKMPKDKFTESDFCPNCGAKMDGGKNGEEEV